MTIQETPHEIRLYIIHEITEKRIEYIKLEGGDEIPEEKEVVVKTLRIPQWFKKDGITSVQQHITAKNTLAKNKCVIYDKYSGKFYVTHHNVDEVARTVFNHGPVTRQIGFTYDSHIHTGQPQVSELRARRN